jgi:hypothetical protein
MPAALNADRRRSHARADFWNPAGVFDLIGRGRVLTIDVAEDGDRPEHSRIEYIRGSSVVATVLARVRQEGRGLGHRAGHTRLRPPPRPRAGRVAGVPRDRHAWQLPHRRGHQHQRPPGPAGVRTGPREAAIRRSLPAGRRHPVHGPHRIRGGQRRRRSVQLHPGVRTTARAPLRHPRRSPAGGRRMDRRVQPGATLLHRRHAQPGRRADAGGRSFQPPCLRRCRWPVA